MGWVAVALFPTSLPDFPWDALEPYRQRAAAHPDGPVVLAVGTPVDPTPAVVREALSSSSDAPGYPTTHGSEEFREAVAAWFKRRRGVSGIAPAGVLATIGSKEFIGLLPGLLGLGERDAVVLPRVAYPTYAVGAVLAGTGVIESDDPGEWGCRDDVRLVWVNSPSNPTGEVLGLDRLAAIVDAARRIGAVVASDECYAELPWEEPWTSGGVPSILDPRVNAGSLEGLLAVCSLSKRSNAAGYRAGFVAGDPAVVARLLEVRRHVGLMVPGPIQHAAAVALSDDGHVAAQREVYGRRRSTLRRALEGAGFTIDHSEAGLYLWATRAEGCWETVAWLADRGIVVAPGDFYGVGGSRHVRIALTASDERIEAASRRLAGPR